ncbi:PSP, proline-rich [Cynara cardunculus var. scolymus]|uniref:PSP, proline-rich n=1 Tax=Cynara cardunculus var. scolymus TaxID=59895 RepID=A0A124SG58_CYNCS|nr:PSP, proline-rich [Cynara cardunculus var. scolymus]
MMLLTCMDIAISICGIAIPITFRERGATVDALHVMGADELDGKLPMEIGELGLRGTNHKDVMDGDRVHTTNCKAMPKETKNSQTSGSCFRKTWQVDDDQTSVQIIFKLLSRKSKKKLEELLHQWSEWHAQQCSPSEAIYYFLSTSTLRKSLQFMGIDLLNLFYNCQGFDEELESGVETYFPALNVSLDKSYIISFYMDDQVKKQKTEDSLFNKDSVPIYDRDFAFALTSGDGMANNESVLDILNASRCFNCEAYDHSLKECPKPFNKVVVNNARKLHQLKSKRPAGPYVLTRYYQDTPGGKFDGLSPGCLDSETRKLLGLGVREFDPPPWLNRMREMGYPPGYLEKVASTIDINRDQEHHIIVEDLEEDQPSGIVIYDNGDSKEENEECLNVNPTEPKRKMSVDFPGINAPIPVKADRSRWATPNLQPTGFNSCSNNIPLNYSYNPCQLPDYRQESSPFMSEYACNNRSYAPGFPLLSKHVGLAFVNEFDCNFGPVAYARDGCNTKSSVRGRLGKALFWTD